MSSFPVTLCVVSLLIACQLLSTSAHARPSTSTMQRFLGRGLDASGGTGTFHFVVTPQITSLDELDFTMNLNGTSLSFETTSSIFKYKYEEFDSNIMEYRYYKSCITSTTPKYSVIDHGISLVFEDATDRTVVYCFNLKEVPLSFEQKVDLMFSEMQKEIRMLKEGNWFLSNKFNKAKASNGVTAVKFGTNSETLDKYFARQDAIGTYSYPGAGYGSSTYGLCMKFPIDTNVTRVEIDVSNVASYSSTCNPTVPVPFLVGVGVGKLYYSTSYATGLITTIESRAVTSVRSASATSNVATVTATLTQPTATNVLCFDVSTNGFTFSGQSFDARCKFRLQGLRVF